MKKILCVLLSTIMALSVTVPAFAANDTNHVEIDGRSPIPIVYIAGDGNALKNADGEQVLSWRSLLSAVNSDDEADSENIKQSVLNVLYPFLVEGLLTDKWDNYYAALEKEIKDIFGEALLDCNGEASNGTDIDKSGYQSNAENMVTDRQYNGTYGIHDYRFWYDWRLDPLETADLFNEYILGIKSATGAEKIGICCGCLGTSVVMSYIAKYGTDDISGVSFSAGTVNGIESISESISGKFNVDAEAINRLLIDCDSLGLADIDSFITASIDMLDKNGMFDTAIGVTRATIYNKVVEGVTSALAMSTFFTWPTYWAAVTADDYNDALHYVFGDEGSEKRKEYAGLIAKIENYNTVVRQNLPELFDEIAENGNICVVAKYGYQIIPVCESCDEIGDQLGSVHRASFGATTAKVYDTLSDEYINQRISEGKGKYISPDKQIDASTCQFPDNTWFIKGLSHSTWTDYERGILLEVVSADRQLTVDDFDLSQFLVWDNDTSVMSPMTEENCHTENWNAEKPVEKWDFIKRVINYFKTLINWFKELVRFVKEIKTAQSV